MSKWRPAQNDHIYENRYPIKRACECRRPFVWKTTGLCSKCGHPPRGKW